MDTLPEEDTCIIPEQKVRRKRNVKLAGAGADFVALPPSVHVVVGTTAGKPKVPKPECRKLRKKLLDIENKNNTLEKTIDDKNAEIGALKRSIEALNEVLNSVPIDELRTNSSIASTKILELSKKNRSLRAELEQVKNRVSKKDMHIDKLDRELKSQQQVLQQNAELVKKCTAADELQTKITSMQQKLFETRNKNVELQNQLKLAQKCLQHEIGESFNINTLSANLNQAHWRGRAQQIITLQQKVQELKARLESYEERRLDRGDYVPLPVGCDLELTKARSTPRFKAGAGGNNSASLGAGDATGAAFDRFTPSVRKSELIHKAKVDSLEKEITGLQAQLEEQRSKILALKVRNKTLNDEVLKYKMRSSELAEQTDYNGINIEAMNEKLNRQRQQFENRIEDLRNDVLHANEERDRIRQQFDELTAVNLELENSTQQKDAYVENLQDVIKRLEYDLRAVTGDFLFSCREFRKEEFVCLLDSLEFEKSRLMLQNKTLTEKLEAERVKLNTANEQIIKHKTRISRMEVKIRDLEKELGIQSDRKKRTQRMAEYANSISRTSLNGSIGSFTFENQSQCQSNTTINSNNSNAETKVQDLTNQLELAHEKITMLKEKLEYLIEEKDSDAKFFEETLKNSKEIIMNTLLSAKSGVLNVDEPTTSTSA